MRTYGSLFAVLIRYELFEERTSVARACRV